MPIPQSPSFFLILKYLILKPLISLLNLSWFLNVFSFLDCPIVVLNLFLRFCCFLTVDIWRRSACRFWNNIPASIAWSNRLIEIVHEFSKISKSFWFLGFFLILYLCSKIFIFAFRIIFQPKVLRVKIHHSNHFISLHFGTNSNKIHLTVKDVFSMPSARNSIINNQP